MAMTLRFVNSVSDTSTWHYLFICRVLFLFITPQEKEVNPLSDHGMENKSTTMEHPKLAGNASSFEAPTNAQNISEKVMDDVLKAEMANAAGQKTVSGGKTEEIYLLDERALLASIARTIGSSGRIRISSTVSYIFLVFGRIAYQDPIFKLSLKISLHFVSVSKQDPISFFSICCLI